MHCVLCGFDEFPQAIFTSIKTLKRKLDILSRCFTSLRLTAMVRLALTRLTSFAHKFKIITHGNLH